MQLTNAFLVSAVLISGAQASLYGESSLNHTCQLRTPLPNFQAYTIPYPNNDCSQLGTETPYLSCSATVHPNIIDSCCTETFGGLILSTQF